MSSSRDIAHKDVDRFNVRIEAKLKTQLSEAATKAGFATLSAYVRHVLNR